MTRGDLLSETYTAEAASWAETLLSGGRVEEANLTRTDAMQDLVARFGLGENERRVLDLAFGVERSPSAGRLLRDLAGRARLTVGVLGRVLGEDAVAALAARRPLRANALVVTSGLPSGVVTPADTVRLGAGVGARLSGLTPPVDALGPGVEVVRPGAKPNLPEAMAAAMKDHVVDVEPSWVVMTGARPSDAGLLAEALAFRLQREVVLLDARAAASLSPADTWELLASVRRECDLADAPLVVDAVAAVRGAWRALVAPFPSGRRARAVVLINAELPLPRAPEGFTSHAVALTPPRGW